MVERIVVTLKNYKMKNLIIIALLAIFIYSCEGDFQKMQDPSDSISPDPVTNVDVKNISGGAVIYYDTPKDEDLAYVKAIYTRANGERAEAKSSNYVDSLVVEGFGDTNEKEVVLYAVDRSSNESTPLSVKVNPLTPPVKEVAKSFTLIPDFGGIQAKWENDVMQEVGIVFLRKDTLSENYDVLETFYTKSKNGARAIRKMAVKERTFAIFMKDRWDNHSDTLFYTMTPLFETSFDKGLFKKLLLPGDYEGVFGWVHEKMWDNQYGGGNGYSSPGGTGVWPQSVTVDLGVLGKLSRIQLKQRTDQFVFAEGNVRKFELYGSAELLNEESFDGWTLLGDFESIKPSGLPMGQNSNEDVQVANDGEDFIVDIAAPKVRYIRIRVKETWAAGDNFQISELAIFGDNR